MFRGPLSLIVLVVVIAFGFGIWLFLLRPEDSLPARPDAVVVLAGSEARLPVALNLVESGIGKTLVVSTDSAENDPDRYALCHGPKPKRYTLVCRRASPFSTRGEARMIGGLVSRYGWHKVVVVSSRYHLYRSKIVIGSCTDAALSMRAAYGDSWWQKAKAIPLEYAKLARAQTLQRGC